MNTDPVDGEEDPTELVTVTWTLPAPAGETAVSSVSETRTTEVAAEAPKLTETSGVNSVPRIATGVPPSAGPDDGVMDEMAGGLPKLSSVVDPQPRMAAERVLL